MGVWSFICLLQVKLDLSCLKDIKDDMDFCCRLAKEELVVVLPGTILTDTWCQTELVNEWLLMHLHSARFFILFFLWLQACYITKLIVTTNSRMCCGIQELAPDHLRSRTIFSWRWPWQAQILLLAPQKWCGKLEVFKKWYDKDLIAPSSLEDGLDRLKSFCSVITCYSCNSYCKAQCA